jgi:hypothetical protein
MQTDVGRQVANGKLDSVVLGVPEKTDLERPASPMSQVSCARRQAFATSGCCALASDDGSGAAGGGVRHRPRSSCRQILHGVPFEPLTSHALLDTGDPYLFRDRSSAAMNSDTGSG